MTPIEDHMIIRLRRDMIAAESDDEMIVLDAERGDFLQLNKTAGRIWALLEEPLTFGVLCARLADQFAVDAADCREDVCAFIGELSQRGLVEIDG
ncbi:MAG TPA: PqqD family protein [Sphingomonas sp.]|nr:PqqD family protein [Sphingomonas sp.]